MECSSYCVSACLINGTGTSSEGSQLKMVSYLSRPQNTPEDIAGLCKATNVSRVLFHPSMGNAASKAEAVSQGSLAVTPTLVYSVEKHDVPGSYEQTRSELCPEEESETDCIIFHSSGSSGTPKVSAFLTES
jgi:hypothetical protein